MKGQSKRHLPVFMRVLWVGALLLAGLSLSVPQTAVSQAETPAILLTVKAGFDGYYKQNSWVPVHIAASNSGTAVEGTLQIEADDTLYSAPISLPTQSNKEVTILVYLAGFKSNLSVTLVDAKGGRLKTAVSNPLDMLNQDVLLYGVLSSDPAGFGSLESAVGKRASAAVAFLKMAEMGETAVSLTPFDILILDNIDSSQFSTAQRDALAAWVNLGGQLVVTGGASWQKTAAPLADLLPVVLEGESTVDDLPDLREAVGMQFRDPGPYLVTHSSLRQGELIYHEAGLPLLARQATGRGGVYFLALDPKLAPLLDWNGTKIMWTAVANRIPFQQPWQHGIQNSYAANEAARSISSLTLPSAWQLLLFLFAYILIIGPVNYLILKRINRRELAWFTVPALVLIFSLLTAFTGFRSRGGQIIINQLSVAVGQSGSSHMQVQTVLGLYSPRRTSFDLTLPLDSAVRPSVEPYMRSSGSGNAPRIGTISRSQKLVVEDINSDVSEVTAFLVDGIRPLPAITAQITTTELGSARKLDITVRNESQIQLENAVLHIAGNIIQLGNLTPGATQTASHTFTITPEEGEGSAIFTPGPTAGDPLVSQADVILGTHDYYSDPVMYPRWQLLSSLISNNFGGNPEPLSKDRITLIAWSEQPLLETEINAENSSHQYTTLYLIDLNPDE